ncbi:MAG: hypothetical protein HDS52_09950 [Barnesiella sp.]|nr:hypothetical protein [Barnesiella sp.]
MKKEYIESVDRYAISCDNGHYLHRIGSQEYPKMRRTRVAPDDIDNWEEIPVADFPVYTVDQYKAKVVELIRERYDIDKEFEIQREMLCAMLPELATLSDDGAGHTAPVDPAAAIAAFRTYDAYVADCKLRAVKELENAVGETDNQI